MATLHGHPIKVGDRVWYIASQDYITIIDIFDGNFIKASNNKIYSLGNNNLFFWQPFTIPPEAYEKPKPKKYQVLYCHKHRYQTTDGKYLTKDDFYKVFSSKCKFIKLLGADDD